MQGPHVFGSTVRYPGRQKVAEIMTELEREQKERKDVVINSKNLRLQVVDDQLLLRIPSTKTDPPILAPMAARVHNQIAQWMHLRMGDGFYKWLVGGSFTPDKKEDKRKNWDILCDTFNSFAKRQSENRLIRLLYNKESQVYARAFLSDRYQIIDSSDFFFTIVASLKKMGAEVWHARLSEDKFYGYAVHPKVSEIIDLTKSTDPNSHTFRKFAKDGSDKIFPAMVFGNSETGEGGCFMQQALCWEYCVNYAVTSKVMNRAHIGRKREEELLLKRETIQAENKVFFMKTADIVESTFDETIFRKFIDKLRGANDDPVEDPEEAADALRVCYDLDEDLKANIRNTFLEKYPKTRYGLIGSVTECAHNESMNPDKGFSLEELGAQLIDMDMKSLTARAKAERKRREKDATSAPALALASADVDV